MHKCVDEVLRVPASMMAGILHSHGEGFVFPSLGLSFFLGNHVVGRYATLLPTKTTSPGIVLNDSVSSQQTCLGHLGAR